MKGLLALLGGFVVGLAIFAAGGPFAVLWFTGGVLAGMVLDAATAPRIP